MRIDYFYHKGICLASRGLPSDAEQLSRVTEFSIHSNNHYGLFFLHTSPSIIAGRLEYVLFYQFYTEISNFAIKKCSVRFFSNMLTSKCFMENGIKA